MAFLSLGLLNEEKQQESLRADGQASPREGAASSRAGESKVSGNGTAETSALPSAELRSAGAGRRAAPTLESKSGPTPESRAATTLESKSGPTPESRAAPTLESKAGPTLESRSAPTLESKS